MPIIYENSQYTLKVGFFRKRLCVIDRSVNSKRMVSHERAFHLFIILDCIERSDLPYEKRLFLTSYAIDRFLDAINRPDGIGASMFFSKAPADKAREFIAVSQMEHFP